MVFVDKAPKRCLVPMKISLYRDVVETLNQPGLGGCFCWRFWLWWVKGAQHLTVFRHLFGIVLWIPWKVDSHLFPKVLVWMNEWLIGRIWFSLQNDCNAEFLVGTKIGSSILFPRYNWSYDWSIRLILNFAFQWAFSGGLPIDEQRPIGIWNTPRVMELSCSD